MGGSKKRQHKSKNGHDLSEAAASQKVDELLTEIAQLGSRIKARQLWIVAGHLSLGSWVALIVGAGALIGSAPLLSLPRGCSVTPTQPMSLRQSVPTGDYHWQGVAYKQFSFPDWRMDIIRYFQKDAQEKGQCAVLVGTPEAFDKNTKSFSVKLDTSFQLVSIRAFRIRGNQFHPIGWSANSKQLTVPELDVDDRLEIFMLIQKHGNMNTLPKTESDAKKAVSMTIL